MPLLNAKTTEGVFTPTQKPEMIREPMDTMASTEVEALRPHTFAGRLLVTALVALSSFVAQIRAQEVAIPDPGLNAAIRAALQKPSGPLTAPDMLDLTNLNACCRDIGSLEGLEAARNLTMLELENNLLSNVSLPSVLTVLTYLDLSANQLTNLIVPAGLTNLTTLNLVGNELPSLSLPADLGSLAFLELGFNQFTNLTLPAGLRGLSVLGLEENQLSQLTLPPGLTNLSILALQHNQLTSLTLPPDMTLLTTLLLGGNPLASLVLSEPIATNLASTLAALRADGVSVFTYPLTAELIRLRQPVGAFQFAISGPPGIYTVLGSTDLVVWSELGAVSNELGKIVFTDGDAHLSPQKFYRARVP